MALPSKLPLYGALGNDFYLAEGDFLPSRDEVRALCLPTDGRQVDGLLLLRPNSSSYEFSVLNADGSHGGLSGNGLRCAAYHLSLVHQEKQEPYRFLTEAGVVEATMPATEEVRLLFHELAPLAPRPLPGQFSPQEIETRVGCTFENIWFVHIGNPHIILDLCHRSFEVSSFDRRALNDMRKAGSILPGGVNVSLLSRKNESEFKLRVWERGVGETSACGSAAMACYLITSHENLAKEKVTIVQPGGPLELAMSSKGLLLTGAVYRISS